MNITKALRDLITHQDGVTHLNENNGNINATHAAVVERDKLRAEIVAYVKALEAKAILAAMEEGEG